MIIDTKIVHLSTGNLILCEKNIAITCRGGVLVVGNEGTLTFAPVEGERFSLRIADGSRVVDSERASTEIDRIIDFAQNYKP